MEPKKRKVEKHGNERWEVDFGEDENGVRRRPLFKTEAEADDAIAAHGKEAKQFGEFWARLKTVERREIVATLQEIRDAGRSVRQVWEDWKRWKRENQQVVLEPMAYTKVVDEWERRKLASGGDARYLHNSRTTVLDKFGEGRAQQPIHEIAAAELENWINARCKDSKHPNDPLRTWGLSSKRTNTSLFSGLWEVAIAKGWASKNITESLEPIGKISRHVRIHPNETVRNLMAACLENDVTASTVLVVFVLGFFGCMRPDEILSKKAIRNGHKVFGWHDIDLDHGLVTVRPEVAKKGDQRTIRLQPMATEWLRLAKKLGNAFPPLNERRLRVQVAELIGFDMTKDGGDWERDGLRKNCATHLRAIYKNDYDVVKDCGNSIRILLKHYADLHTPEDVSLEYWQITVEAVEAYRKTEAWKKLLIEASKAPRALLANGTDTPGR